MKYTDLSAFSIQVTSFAFCLKTYWRMAIFFYIISITFKLNICFEINKFIKLNKWFDANRFHTKIANIWAGPWENVSYVICEQQRRRSACASAQSDQRLCCSLLRYYNTSRFYSRNFKTLASFCGCAGRFVSGRKLPKIRFVVSWFIYIS